MTRNWQIAEISSVSDVSIRPEDGSQKKPALDKLKDLRLLKETLKTSLFKRSRPPTKLKTS